MLGTDESGISVVGHRASHLELLLYAVAVALGHLHSSGRLDSSFCGVAQRFFAALLQDDALEATQALLVGQKGILLPQRIRQRMLRWVRLQQHLQIMTILLASSSKSISILGTSCFRQ